MVVIMILFYFNFNVIFCNTFENNIILEKAMMYHKNVIINIWLIHTV